MNPPPVLPDGWTLVARDRVGSTNDEAGLLAEGGAPEGTFIWAREQTGGRGRRGRSDEEEDEAAAQAVGDRRGVQTAIGFYGL